MALEGDGSAVVEAEGECEVEEEGVFGGSRASSFSLDLRLCSVKFAVLDVNAMWLCIRSHDQDE